MCLGRKSNAFVLCCKILGYFHASMTTSGIVTAFWVFFWMKTSRNSAAFTRTFLETLKNIAMEMCVCFCKFKAILIVNKCGGTNVTFRHALLPLMIKRQQQSA